MFMRDAGIVPRFDSDHMCERRVDMHELLLVFEVAHRQDPEGGPLAKKPKMEYPP